MQIEELMKKYVKKVDECDKYRNFIVKVKNYCTEKYEEMKEFYDDLCDGDRHGGCTGEERELLLILDMIKKLKGI